MGTDFEKEWNRHEEERNRRAEFRKEASEKKAKIESMLFNFVESTINEPRSDAAVAALPEVAKLLVKLIYRE